ncbi:ureD urease accessory family protein [Collimonas arenae]|uniref:Urease accessory protein UreD n=1 Tax=Collimonas arenae TaxID=279058 RepID=A0A127QHQ2_9BURK|nr:urease accessory protein UreD [Collimonas arenae]AMO99433.1 ureD urease accessory family protein [Collimonas arenae]AMP09335.1 ureD urease accessory family protein [Collimonas arenae]
MDNLTPSLLQPAADPAFATRVQNSANQAWLSLRFADDRGTTRLLERAHYGPLRVQKALYPEHPSVCHAIIVHPPGGVVGGDQLTIKAEVGEHGHAFLTTPGAAKWYQSNGKISQQQVRLQIADKATLEWLPQETIFFDQADVELDHQVELQGNARYIGGEILCFGRTASGESFDSGRIAQHTTIRRDGKLLWFEQGTLGGGSAAMRSRLGLADCTVCATLIVAGKAFPAAFVQQLRDAASLLSAGQAGVGASQIKSLLVLRYLGHSSELARQWMMQAWQRIRPELLEREAHIPRIWNT